MNAGGRCLRLKPAELLSRKVDGGVRVFHEEVEQEKLRERVGSYSKYS